MMQTSFLTDDEQDEELKLLRRIATHAYLYGKDRMREDSLKLRALAKEWHKKYGRKKK
jgi:hypothetical protein